MPGYGKVGIEKIRGAKQTLLRRRADRYLLLSVLHSAAVAAPEVFADVMKRHNI
jgi:hypothetical protein